MFLGTGRLYDSGHGRPLTWVPEPDFVVTSDFSRCGGSCICTISKVSTEPSDSGPGLERERIHLRGSQTLSQELKAKILALVGDTYVLLRVRGDFSQQL